MKVVLIDELIVFESKLTINIQSSNLPSETNAPPIHVTPHKNRDPASDHLRPILFIAYQAIE